MKYNKSATLRFAFKQSLPVLFGYLFLGAAFGIMLFKAGYNWVWAALICASTVFTKQHSIIDVVCGLAVAFVWVPVVYRPAEK